MTDVRLIRRNADPAVVDLLVTRPCETLAALMTAQLPRSPELAGGLAKLDEARKLFRLAAALQLCPPGYITKGTDLK